MPKRLADFTIAKPSQKRQRTSSWPYTAVLHIQPYQEAEVTIELTVHEDFMNVDGGDDATSTSLDDQDRTQCPLIENDSLSEYDADDAMSMEGEQDHDLQEEDPGLGSEYDADDAIRMEEEQANDNSAYGGSRKNGNRDQSSLIVFHILQGDQQETRNNNSRTARITTWRTQSSDLLSELGHGLGPENEPQPDWQWYIDPEHSDLDEAECEEFEAGTLLTYGGKQRSPINTRKNAEGAHVDIPEPIQLQRVNTEESTREDRILEGVIVLLVVSIAITLHVWIKVFDD